MKRIQIEKERKQIQTLAGVKYNNPLKRFLMRAKKKIIGIAQDIFLAWVILVVYVEAFIFGKEVK